MRVETGVRVVFSASHRDPTTGLLHGHDYEVIAWYENRVDEDTREPTARAEDLRDRVHEYVKQFEHRELAPELWSAEALAEDIYMGLKGCHRVQINRPLLGIFVVAEGPPLG